MNNKIDYEKWFQNAINEKKFEALEFLINEDKNLTISLENNKIYEKTKSELISTIIKGLYKNKKSSIYLEKIDDNMLDKILKILKKQIKVSHFDSQDYIFKGKISDYPIIENQNFNFEKIESQKKHNILFELYKKISKNHLCKKIEMISYSETHSKKKIINSKGLNLESEENFVTIYITCIFEKNNQIEEISEYFIVKKFENLNIEEYANQIIEKGEKKIGATSIQSGSYCTVFSNKTFAKLLKSFSSVFSGLNAYRNLTKFKNKINKKIASSKVTIIDDPTKSSAFFQYSFDDEGIPSKKKIIVEKGIFKQFIHNLKTAHIFKTIPTGNSFNNQIKMSNCYLKRGIKNFDEMISPIKKGILIDNLIGLHAGINNITGDFSIQAEGFKIEKGKITKPIKMIVVSGNFFDILSRLKEISNDFLFDISGFGSSSVYIGKLSIAGEK
ncbi:TldD/PmbA family protein ['Cynodon dactylon' phytoplasma]|uniref:TldD/PmbA family protein n=1 Tax='Cynodon dactylon' phytoplasma TaxID=295320 RepID=UPI001265CD0D|nr:TldD/PmbA family protein ['Cynodon dactylon' phytoplasma]KAB8121768.1 TldD/PmbA family protein ['Cynodon dactylon' phytoplasma]